MRKHFLLLFLMALLPLVGWADDPKPKVIINAAYTYKTYGDVDPTNPNFEFDQPSQDQGDVRNVIKNFLVLKRVNGEENQGEDVGSYLYYIDFTDNYAQDCPYEITILQNNSNLVIRKAPLTVHVNNYWKKYRTADPADDEWDWTIPDETQLKRGDKAEDLTIDITRDEGEAFNAQLNQEGTEATHIDGKDVYEFHGIAQNYDITFDNEFLIVPTDDTNNIKVVVVNSNVDDPYVDTDSYTYKGTKYFPGRANYPEQGDVFVYDGDDLVSPDDYDVPTARKYWGANTHVGDDCRVSVILKNSYTGDNLTKTGSFTIKKAPLEIYGDIITMQPGQAEPDLTHAYFYNDGWKNGEGTSEGPNTNPKPKNFTEPSGVTKEQIPGTDSYKLKVNQDASADDYEISYPLDGVLSYGKIVLNVVPDPGQGKVYGEEDEKLEYSVKHQDGSYATEEELEAIGGDQPYFTISREEGEDVGSYAITFDGPTVAPEGIILNYGEGIFTISRRTVYLKGDNTGKVYGDADPTFEASVYEKDEDGEYIESSKWSDEKKAENGVTNGDFYYVGVGQWYNNRWNHSENVGEYAVEPHLMRGSGNPVGRNAGRNYRVVIEDGNGVFKITKAPLTITADNKSKGYDQADPVLTVTVDGMKRGESLVRGVDYTIAREAGEAIGTYAITVTPGNTAKLANYEVTCVDGVFTITKQVLEVVANDQAIDYGQKINPYDVIIKINGVDQEWSKEEIAAVLELTTEVTKVGATKDAYTLVPADNIPYDISEDNFTNAWLTIAPLKTIPLDKEALKAITDVELKQVLEDHKGRTLNVTLPARKMDANEWYAWVLPFEVKQRVFFTEDVWGYGAMEKLDEGKTTATNVTFSLTVQSIPANTPFIVKVDENITAAQMKNMTFTVKIDDSIDYVNENPTSGSESTVQFIGVYEENKEKFDNTVRVLRRGEDGHMAFYAATDLEPGMFVRTNAYLQFPTEDAAREAKIYVEDPNGGATTEITGVKAEANSMNAEGWYNLNGVKMEGAPAQKGVYIKDGKKVVIK